MTALAAGAIRTLDDATRFLSGLSASSTPELRAGAGMAPARALLGAIGDPQDELRAVHVLDRLAAPVRAMATSAHGRPTYFEVLNALAFRLFADERVDYAVVETGIGGLHDATNTLNRSDKPAVVTAIGLDHTRVLTAPPSR